MLKGYTVDSQPGKILSPNDLLVWLASNQNTSDFTHAMGSLMVKGYRGDNAFSATTLTSTCPREFQLKQDVDYTLRLESGMYAIDGTFFHAMVESTPTPEAYEVIRERRYAKRITIDGDDIIIPGRMDEIVLNFHNGGALLRDYKRTKKTPSPFDIKTGWGGAYPTHKKQLDIYRWMLSDVDGPPIQLPEGLEFWKAQPKDWVEVEPINVVIGEIVYRSFENVKRIQVGADQKQKFTPIEEVSEWIKQTVVAYLGEEMVGYTQATSKDGFGFGWKCNDYCPVKDQCFSRKETEQPFSEQRAHASNAPKVPVDPSDDW